MTPSPRRRLGALLATLVALVAVLAWAAPAAAHGGARITVNHDGKGSIWVTVASDDGHPSEDIIDATMSAREASGATIEPTKMVQSSAPGTLVYMSTLPAGAWTVNVEFGPPIARVCEAAFQVGTSNTTQTVRCDGPTAVAASAPPTEGGVDSGAWLLIAIAAAGGVAVVVIALLLRRRSGPDRAATPKRTTPKQRSAKPREKSRT